MKLKTQKTFLNYPRPDASGAEKIPRFCLDCNEQREQDR